jgi:outer membrane receptor protein involved in Fe transport
MSERAALLLFLVLSLSFSVLAQTRSLGAIRGTVTDPQGAVVAGADIVVKNQSTGFIVRMKTDSSGTYAATGLPLTGTYVVEVSSAGFKTVQTKGIQLEAGHGAVANLVLAVEGRAETISLDEDLISDLNTTDASVQTVLDLREIDNTPVFGRKATTLPLLDSSVRPARGTGDLFLNNTLFVINGSGRRQTTYSVDNATGDDSWGRQTLFTTIPLSAIQEFTVLQNAASAEYGRTTGSAINVVTKSGTNKYHGDLLALFRPANIQARVPLSKVDTTDALYQGSATVGGPIVKDKTFFNASYERSNQDRDSVITSILAPGTYTGHFTQDLFLGRLDHYFSDQNSFTLRANFDRFDDSNPADAVGGTTLPSAGRIFSRDTYSLLASDTWVFNPTLVNQARFQFQLGSPITRFTPVTPSTQFVRSGVSTEGESRVGDLMNHQYEFADTVAKIIGKHDLRFGADVIYSSSGGIGQEFGGGFTLGQFNVKPNVLTPLGQLTINDVNRYTQSFGNLNYNVKETLTALFVQDNWMVMPRLTLNLGLRYENQTLTDDTNNAAPRFGFAWQPFASGNTVVRGGYGIFYSEERSNIAAGYKIGGPEGIFTFSAVPGGLGFPTTLAPLPAFPAGATLPARDITVKVGQRTYLNQFFDVSKLRFYPDKLLNPYTQQWNLGVQHQLATNTVLSVDYLGQHTIKIERPVDLNAPDAFVRTAAGQCRTMLVGVCNANASVTTANSTRPILPANNGYRRIIALVNAGANSYNGVKVNLSTRRNRFQGLFSYTLSHTIGTVEMDVPQQDPNDSNFIGNAEKATSLLDQRHRLSVSGSYELPWKFTVGTWFVAASGRPFNVTTGVDNNGDGSTADRPVVNGVLLPRNFGKGTPVYDLSLFAEKQISLTERFKLSLRAEGFNLTNHNNIVGRNGTWGNADTPVQTYGTPLGGINNVDPGREFQFMARFRF